MIEENLLQYGVLGVWTIVNLYMIKYFIGKLDDKDKKEEVREERLTTIINNNTIALTRAYENIRACKLKNGN